MSSVLLKRLVMSYHFIGEKKKKPKLGNLVVFITLQRGKT